MKQIFFYIKNKAREIFQFIGQVFKEYIADNVLKYSASLAYYTVLSLGPLLVIIVTITGKLFKNLDVNSELNTGLQDMVGENTAKEIQNAIANIHVTDANFASLVSLVVLFIGATGIFGEMQDSLNKIWGLRIKARRVWWKVLTDRLVSFSLILSLGFVLIVSLGLNALVSALNNRISEVFGTTGNTIISGLDTLISFIITTGLFATIFKVLPDAKIKWKDVFVGAVITSLLFGLGKYLISFYINKSTFLSVYNTAGTIMILMVWVYYSSAILYLGAVFTKVYATNHGSKIYPSEYSVWVKTEEVPMEHFTLQDNSNARAKNKEIIKPKK